MEIAHVSINRRMDKQTVIYPYNGILLAITRNHYCMQNHGSISKALLQGNKARPRRPHTIWLHLYEILGKGDLIYSGYKQMSSSQDQVQGNFGIIEIYSLSLL